MALLCRAIISKTDNQPWLWTQESVPEEYVHTAEVMKQVVDLLASFCDTLDVQDNAFVWTKTVQNKEEQTKLLLRIASLFNVEQDAAIKKLVDYHGGTRSAWQFEEV
jgi:hypothetical protein